MENKNTAKEITTVEKTRYVVSKDGIRMTYKEWREMIEAERY